MLCAGVVHGDLSEFNILLGADGPVIIDLPQAVDAAGNNHARACCCATWTTCATPLLRPLCARAARHRYGPEIWDLYASRPAARGRR
jgi:RIO kinase 1